MAVGNDALRVLVIGAGSAGLLIAQGLKKVGISCTVFEADATSTTRKRDWNFGIYWAQSPLSDCLPDELAQRLESCQVDDHKPAEDDFMPIFNAETCELLLAMSTPFSLRLQRRKFLKLLSTGLDIRYGKRLANLHSDDGIVTATFEDGSVETGNLLIGAEGAHSVTREFLVGPRKGALIPSPIIASVCMTKLPVEAVLKFREMHYRYTVNFHPKGIFAWVGVHNCSGSENPEDWEFMIMQSWVSPEKTNLPSKGPEVMRDFKDRAKNFGEPLRFIYESIPDNAPVWHNRLSLWPTQEFDDHDGTVTLAGDSAHPMTYHRGQGLNNAILDAANFLSQLRKMNGHTPQALAEAVTAYSHELWVRGKEAVLSSNKNSLQVHDWDLLKKSPLFVQGVSRNV